MKISKIAKTAVPKQVTTGRKPGPVTLAVRALTPRTAYRFTCANSIELNRIRVTAIGAAKRDKHEIVTQKRGNELFVFLKS